MGHFYFTRHGQTVWNVENKICGATDIELTELGHEQAMELGRNYERLPEGVVRKCSANKEYWEKK